MICSQVLFIVQCSLVPVLVVLFMLVVASVDVAVLVMFVVVYVVYVVYVANVADVADVAGHLVLVIVHAACCYDAVCAEDTDAMLSIQCRASCEAFQLIVDNHHLL